MKRIVLFLLLAFMLSTSGFAEAAPDRTLGKVNGRFWQNLTSTSRLYFLVGFQAGFSVATPVTADLTREQAFYLPSTMSFGEIVQGIDRFYEEPENLILPVIEGLEIFAFKANGATPTRVESKLAAFRERNVKAVEEERKKVDRK